MTAKTYADTNDVEYDYTAAGRLYQRKWQRTTGGNPVTTTFAYYVDAGTPKLWTGQLMSVSYNDGTAGVSFEYNRTGRKESVTDAVGERPGESRGRSRSLTEPNPWGWLRYSEAYAKRVSVFARDKCSRTVWFPLVEIG